MAIHIRRRELVVTLCSAAAAWPLAARAQQSALPVIGYLSTVSPGPFAPNLAAFRRGLSQTGFIEGQNVTIEYRWAEGHYDRLAALANELVRRRVDVIVAAGGSGAAAKAATATIPIVTLSGGDPVEEGLVASLSRPGGNVTGVALFANSLGPKPTGRIGVVGIETGLRLGQDDETIDRDAVIGRQQARHWRLAEARRSCAAPSAGRR